MSPPSHVAEEQGLLDSDELFYEEENSIVESAHDAAEEQAAARFGDDGHEESEDDEVVFGSADISSRRTSATTTSVDPDAPTPAVARRTERKFASPVDRTPPAANSSSNRLQSPSYNFGDDAGLLDE